MLFCFHSISSILWMRKLYVKVLCKIYVNYGENFDGGGFVATTNNYFVIYFEF